MAKVPSYRHHKARDLAIVRIGGRDHYLGKYGTPESKRAYKRLIQEWESSGRGTAFGLSKDQTTVAMLWEDYLDTLASDFGPRSLKAVREKMPRSKVSNSLSLF